MGGKRTEPDTRGARSASLFAGRAGIPTAVAAALLVLGIVASGVVYGWQRWGKSVVARPIYRLQAESFQITPPPRWIRTDVRAEIVRDGALEDLTIFDKDATIRVFQAFELHPWVAKVLRVSKHPPAQLVVDLEYRQPVAWVEVAPVHPGETGGVIPVDALGFVLPSRDFAKADLEQYLRIAVPEPRPYGLAGTAWGDSRIVGGAKIAALLLPHWKGLGLYRIQLLQDPDFTQSAADPVYELETVAQTTIIWGHAPGAEGSHEPSATMKVRRLQQLVEEGGPLQPGTDRMDLRAAPSLQTVHAPRPGGSRSR